MMDLINSCMRLRKITKERYALFVQCFPIMSNVEVAVLMKVSLSTVKSYAETMGLTKDPAYLSQVRKSVSKKGHLARWKQLRTRQNG